MACVWLVGTLSACGASSTAPPATLDGSPESNRTEGGTVSDSGACGPEQVWCPPACLGSVGICSTGTCPTPECGLTDASTADGGFDDYQYTCLGYVSRVLDGSPSVILLLPVPSSSFDAGLGRDLPVLAFCAAADAGLGQLTAECVADCNASLPSYANAVNAQNADAALTATDLKCTVVSTGRIAQCP
jgi:hypothetical protein